MSSLQRGNVTPSVNLPIDASATSAVTTLNVSAKTIVKAALAGLCGSTSRSLAQGGHYSASIAGIATANLVATIPAIVGPLWLDFPCQAGITVAPGSGQTPAVSFY